MTHTKLAELAAIGADKAFRAAKHLSTNKFGVTNPMMISRSQQGAESIAEAEAIRLLTDIYCDGAGTVHTLYKLSSVTTKFV